MADVLVIDDDLLAAERFARLVRAETGLGVAAARSFTAAVSAVENDEVKVAVLDQRLDQWRPPDTGTRVFHELRKINPLLRGVMLSGQAAAADFQQAIREGFSDYLDKNEVARLSEVVRVQYEEYIISLAEHVRRAAPLLVRAERRGFSLRGPSVNFEVFLFPMVRDVTGSSVTLDQWELLVDLDIGQTKRAQITRTVETSVVVESEAMAKVGANAGLQLEAVAELKQSIEHSARARHMVTRSGSSESIREETFTLPIGTSVAGVGVRHRRFLRAPLYSRTRCLVRVGCTCCGMTQFFNLPVLSWTGEFATKQVDYLEDETSREFLIP